MADETAAGGVRGGRLRQDRRPGRRGRLAAAGPGAARPRLSPSSCRSTAASASARVPVEPTEHVFTVPLGAPHRRRPAVAVDACPTPTCRSTWSSSPTTSSATTRPQGRGLYQFTLPGGQQARLPRQLRAVRLLLPGRPRGAAAARLLARRPARQRLADRPGPGLPRRGLPPAADAGLRAVRRVRTLFTIHNIAYQGAVLALGHAR